MARGYPEDIAAECRMTVDEAANWRAIVLVQAEAEAE